MYVATDRPLARILLLLLLYKKVLDLLFPAVATIHLKGLIFLETELIVKLNLLLAEVQESGSRIHKHGTLRKVTFKLKLAEPH